MRWYLLAVGVLFELQPSFAHAQDKTVYAHGWQLHAQCQNPEFKQGCLGFILGVVDATTLLLPSEVCIPEEFVIGGMVDLVNAYLVSYPDHEEWAAVEIVADVLQLSFPCPPA